MTDRKCPCCGCKDLQDRNVGRYTFPNTEKMVLRVITDNNYYKGIRFMACSNCGYIMAFEAIGHKL